MTMHDPHPSDSPPPAPGHLVLRVLSVLAGLLVLVTGTVFSFGTALAAPLGMVVARLRAQRRGRPVTLVASWLSAVMASSLALVLAILLFLALASSDTIREMEKVIAEAQVQNGAIPQGAPSDSLTQEFVQSRGFLLAAGTLGAVLGCVLIGSVAGSAGWIGARLIGYGVRGSFGGQPMAGAPE